jgi:hypothetical protein
MAMEFVIFLKLLAFVPIVLTLEVEHVMILNVLIKNILVFAQIVKTIHVVMVFVVMLKTLQDVLRIAPFVILTAFVIFRKLLAFAPIVLTLEVEHVMILNVLIKNIAVFAHQIVIIIHVEMVFVVMLKILQDVLRIVPFVMAMEFVIFLKLLAFVPIVLTLGVEHAMILNVQIANIMECAPWIVITIHVEMVLVVMLKTPKDALGIVKCAIRMEFVIFSKPGHFVLQIVLILEVACAMTENVPIGNMLDNVLSIVILIHVTMVFVKTLKIQQGVQAIVLCAILTIFVI